MMTKNILFSLAALSITLHTPAANAEIFYDDAVVTGARANADRFDWAREEKKTIVGIADIWLSMSDDEVWNYLSEQTIPRAIFASQPARCPIHGSLEKHGDYAWQTTTEKKWKVQCPIGGESWPTNDFDAYHKSGKNSKNIFDRTRANAQHLRSKDPARNYGVDDGNGFAHDGTRSYFAAYWAFWGSWQRVARAETNAVTMLSQAYLLTGKQAYATKAMILIARAADLYPEMDVKPGIERGIPANDGYTKKGKVLGKMWDDEIANNFMRAYDAVRPSVATDTALHKFLGEKSRKHGLTPQGSAEQIHAHIEANLLERVMDAVENEQIRSNDGRHQLTYAMAAALLGPDVLAEAQAWLNAPGDPHHGGGHLPQMFWEYIDRDGAGNEGSPYYNSIWLESLIPLAEVLQKSGQENVFKTYPHLRKLLLYPGRMVTLGAYYPSIGDSGTTGGPEYPLPNLSRRYVRAYQDFGDEEAALLAYHLNGNSEKGLNGGLFGGDAKSVEGDIKRIVASRGAVWARSDNMNGYGLAQHQAGRGKYARTAWMYWGRTGHGGNHPHSDRLNIGLFAYGLDLLPDLGYPDVATVWPTTQGWIKNTVSHNTVVVDGRRQNLSHSGDQRIFADTPRVQFSEVDGGDVYDQASLYRRSTAMIQVNDRESYMVDLFRIHGGNEHVYSFHAAEGDVSTSGLNLQSQGSGTYAGAGVKFGAFYDEPLSGKYSGSGFQFLDQVESDAQTGEAFAVDWKIHDTHGVLPAEWKDKVHLRMTMLGNEGQASLANGYPAKGIKGNPESLRYLLVKNQGANLKSRFLGVIEPYLEKRIVAATDLIEIEGRPDKDVVALRVTLANGRTDYVFSALDDQTYTTADGRFTFRGPYAVYAERGGQRDFSFLADGGELRVDGEAVVSADSVEGTVISVDYDGTETQIVVDGEIPDDGSFTNQWVDFKTGNGHDANFRVAAVTRGNGQSTLTITDTDPVMGLKTPGDPAGGFKLVIEPGARYHFPAVVQVRGEAYEMLEVELDGHTADASSLEARDSEGGCASAGRTGPLWMLLAGLLLAFRLKRRRTD